MLELLAHTHQALVLVLVLSLPLLMPIILAGLTVAIIQAVTQIQEQTLPFAAKLIVGIAVLAFASPWIAAQIYNLFIDVTETAMRLR